MPFVYRTFNARGRLLYVGCTKRWPGRMRDHESTAPWFGDIAGVSVHYYADLRTALAAEDRAIKTEWPLWNSHGEIVGGTAVEQYALQRWQESCRALERAYAGKPGVPVLHGAAKTARDARRDREFEERLQHTFHVRRLIEATPILMGNERSTDWTNW